MKTETLLRFEPTHTDLFRRWSHDENPLHLDAGYAASSQFGQIVVYGMATVIRVIGAWAKGRSFSLESLDAEFKRPVFLHQDYEFEAKEEGSAVTLRLKKGPLVRLTVRLKWKSRSPTTPGKTPADFRSLTTATAQPVDADLPGFYSRSKHYDADEVSDSEVETLYGLRPSQLPASQWRALLWASYFVGMEAPGRQALFSGFKAEFDGEDSSSLDLKKLDVVFDERFQQYRICGSATGIPSFSIEAFRRPEEIRYRMSDIEKLHLPSSELAGKTVLVTGAGRGLGSALALAFANRKAHVLLNVRRRTAEVNAIQAEISAAGATSEIVLGDIASPEFCQAWVREFTANGKKIDLLVNNAWPTPPVFGVKEEDPREMLRYLNAAVASALYPMFYFLPALPKKSVILNISSVFVESYEAKFASYTASKAALEAYTRAFAAELGDYRFIVARPTRVLTDTTNVIQAADRPPSASAMAVRIVDRLLAAPEVPGMSYLRLNEE